MTNPTPPNLPEVSAEFIESVLKEHTPTEDRPNFCPECHLRHPCDVHRALQQQRERAEKAEDRIQCLIEQPHTFHECRGVIRSYPSLLCSMHPPKYHESEDFDAKEMIMSLRTQLADKSAENARLREALEDIEERALYAYHMSEHREAIMFIEDLDTIAHKAHQALHGSPAAGGKDEDE